MWPAVGRGFLRQAEGQRRLAEVDGALERGRWSLGAKRCTLGSGTVATWWERSCTDASSVPQVMIVFVTARPSAATRLFWCSSDRSL